MPWSMPRSCSALQLHVGQNVVEPAAGLPLVEAARRLAGPAHPQPPVGRNPWACSCSRQARPICLRLLLHCICRAASRAACTAGSNSAIRMPMIVITTKSSTSVKPRGERGEGRGEREANARGLRSAGRCLAGGASMEHCGFVIGRSFWSYWRVRPNESSLLRDVDSVAPHKTLRASSRKHSATTPEIAKSSSFPLPLGEGWGQCGRCKGWRVCPPPSPHAPLPMGEGQVFCSRKIPSPKS